MYAIEKIDSQIRTMTMEKGEHEICLIGNMILYASHCSNCGAYCDRRQSCIWRRLIIHRTIMLDDVDARYKYQRGGRTGLLFNRHTNQLRYASQNIEACSCSF